MKDIGELLSFVKPYWKKSLLALILLTLVVISDLAIPRLVQRVIDQGILKGDMQVVIHTFLLMLAISVTNMIFAIGNNNLSVQVGESVARDLREALFLKIQSFSYGNLDRLQTGQLLVRLSSDTTVFQRLVQISLRIGTRAPLLMIGSLIFMFNTDRNLALAMMPLLFLTLVIIVFYVSRTSPLYMTVQKKLDKLNTLLQENIAGVRLVRAFVRRDYESQRFEVQNEEFTERNIKVMQFMATMSPVLNAMVNIGIVAIIWGGDSGRGDNWPAGSLHQLLADHIEPIDDYGQPGKCIRGGICLSPAHPRNFDHPTRNSGFARCSTRARVNPPQNRV